MHLSQFLPNPGTRGKVRKPLAYTPQLESETPQPGVCGGISRVAWISALVGEFPFSSVGASVGALSANGGLSGVSAYRWGSFRADCSLESGLFEK